MVYESTYPKDVSSNPDGKPGLSDEAEAPWSPDAEDPEKSVTVTVAEVSEYIDSVKITGMSGVSTVTVSVDEEVICLCSIKIRFSS